MAKNELRFKIVVEQNMGKALGKARQALTRFGNAAGKTFTGLGAKLRGALNFKSVAAGAVAAVGAIGLAVRQAFKFETLETQFKVLLGNASDAAKRMEELKKFASSTPFKLSEIAQASKSLEVFMGKGKGTAENLRDIGDAAAAVGQPLEDVTFWVGRAYAAIKGGQPFGEASARLQEMGIMTPKVRRQMEEMAKAGEPLEKVFGVLKGRLGEFEGGMKELSQTGNGLISTLKDNWSLALADFGQAFMDLSKGAITGLIDKISKLRQDGTIEEWAEKSAFAVQALASVMGDIFKGGAGRQQGLADLGNFFIAAFTDAGHAFMKVVGPGIVAAVGNIPGMKAIIATAKATEMAAAQKGAEAEVFSHMKKEGKTSVSANPLYSFRKVKKGYEEEYSRRVKAAVGATLSEDVGEKREVGESLKGFFAEFSSRKREEIAKAKSKPVYASAKVRQAEWDAKNTPAETKTPYNPMEMNQRILAARIKTRVKGLAEDFKSGVKAWFTDGSTDLAKVAEREEQKRAQMRDLRATLGSGMKGSGGFSNGIQGKRLGRKINEGKVSDAVLGASSISLGEFVDKKRGQASGKQELGSRGNPSHVVVENMETE